MVGSTSSNGFVVLHWQYVEFIYTEDSKTGKHELISRTTHSIM